MLRWLAAVPLVALLAGCGGSSGADPGPTPAGVTVSGSVTFDRVPVVAGQGLVYSQTVAQPARGVTVELLQNGAAIASTTTDAAGNYFFGNVAPNADVAVRVRAEMLRVGSPSWDFRVVDNVNGEALVHARGRRFQHGYRGRHAQSARRVRLDRCRLHGDALRGAVRHPRRRLRRRAARAHGRAAHGVSCAAFPLEHGERPRRGHGSGRDRLEPLSVRCRHSASRGRQSRHRRIRPARHRARARALSRASLLALRQHRRSARADGPARHAPRVRRGLGQRVRGDGHRRAYLRRQP